jgi:prolyl 4-hydroxylase
MPDRALSHYIRVYDANLDPRLCGKLIESFATLGRFHERNGAGVREALADSAWTELNVTRLSDPGFLGMFRMQVDAALARYNSEVGLTIPVPNSPKTADLILKRYQPGGSERFQVHFDSVHEVSNRYLVLLWYLNDVAEGGETEFPDIGLRIGARAGRLLMFPPYWTYQHAGLPPVSGDKYILSTYLLF